MTNNSVERIAKVILSVTIVLIIVIFSTIFIISYQVMYHANQQDWSNGIKPVIEKLWCGKPDCMNTTEK